RFGDIPQVEVHCGALESLPRYDCIATAGNSFGLMDAGLDLAIVRYFGRPLMEVIQARILRDYLGEQPVGTSFLVRTGMPERPFVAHTPTMRNPMNISGTDQVYAATWATLLAAAAHNRSGDPPAITTLALPGFGTGTGGVEILEASLQMRLAIEHFLKPPAFLNPTVAQERHERIHYGGRWGFLNPRPRADLVD
ncbi:MAG: macro domain-containing protein, partial [Verrucomicrobiales bacterium]